MLRYFLESIVNNIATYSYYPESTTSGKGIVTIDMRTGVINIVRESTDDYHKWYAYKLAKRLETFFRDGSYDEKGLVAWY